MKIKMLEQQTSKSPKHFFVWGDEFADAYKDETVTHVAQQFGDVIRIVKLSDLMNATYKISAAKTFRTYFQWDLDDLTITTIR